MNLEPLSRKGARRLADLRAFAQYLAERADVLAAIASNDDTGDENALHGVYECLEPV